MKKISTLVGLLALGALSHNAFAGNPDRQGEAGAYELLLNPYARSAGLNGLVSARITGLEATFYNPAGLARLNGSTEIAFGHSQYLVNTGMSTNSAGLAQRIKENGAIAINLMSFGFGDIPLTTVSQPEGISTFSPSFFNIGLSYAHIFRDKDKREKVTVGATVRVVSETISNASATGVCFDAGVQYTAGDNRQLRLGVALRNIGSKMKFGGEGLSYPSLAPNGTTSLTINQRGAGFDMPSLLHIGLSYDFLLSPKMSEDSVKTFEHRITPMFNFTANSYSRDQIGLAVEYGFKEMFFARTGFRYESQMFDPETSGTLSSGLTAGVGVEIPFKKGSNRRLTIDYAYEYTRVFQGSHFITAKVAL